MIQRLTGTLLALACVAPALAELKVISVDPPPHSASTPTRFPITVTFDRPVDSATVTPASFWAFGRQSGDAAGAITLLDGGVRMRLTPDRRFAAGETVIVLLSSALRAADGSAIRVTGYSWLFGTRVRSGPSAFTQIDVFSTNLPAGASSRPYGGLGGDLDLDGWLDFVIVNEDTNDVRVCMNLDDGSGLFGDILTPTHGVGAVPSPSDSGDFNRDGQFDVTVSNRDSAQVSVLLGDGDGTFAPAQNIGVGSAPLGIVSIDVDGDGDLDIVNANRTTSNMSVLLNNGAGVFGAPTFYEGGVSGERALASADMNEDGLIDLVVGGITNQRISVNLSNGDGTFTALPSVPAGGAVWMVSVADVNGDGHVDVASGNSSTNNAVILLGNGVGGLAASQTLATDPFTLAVDFCDAEGDGDPDLLTSSYSGDWRLFRNNGAGVFTFDREFNAVISASCAIAMDIDNDRDMDLMMVDEEADTVAIWKNSGTTLPGDTDGDCDVDLADLSSLLESFGCAGVSCSPDIDDDGDVDLADLSDLLEDFGTSCP